MIDLFAEMVEGLFTFSQVRFIATVYGFSCNITEPNLIELLQQTDIDPVRVTVVIHIKLAHALLTNCLNADLSAELLAPMVDASTPMLDYFEFLRDAGSFFGVKHKIIYHQVKDLLVICGAVDPSFVNYELFECFMCCLGLDRTIKDDWKSVLKTSDVKRSSIRFQELIGACAQRREVMLEIMNLPPLQNSVSALPKLSEDVRAFHRELVLRFGRIVTGAIAKSPNQPAKVGEIRSELRQALLSVDIERALWLYRLLVNKVDKTIMLQKGFIPFDRGASPETMAQISEYIRRCESVVLALVND
jgi:hypothetical protein